MLKEDELKAEKYNRDTDKMAAREITIGEMLDRRIHKAATLMHTLQDLRNSLPQSYLNSGASRIASILEL